MLTLILELPEEWIVKYKDKLIGNKPMLKIQNAENWNKKVDKKVCILLGVTVPRDDVDAEASASVVLWENGAQVGDPISVPVRYLVPIPPEQLGATVAVFMGPLAGKQAVVRSIDLDAEVMVVQSLEDQVLEDVQKEYVTLCVADHFG